MTVQYWYHSGNDIEREGSISIGDGIAVCVPSGAQLAMTLGANFLNMATHQHNILQGFTDKLTGNPFFGLLSGIVVSQMVEPVVTA